MPDSMVKIEAGATQADYAVMTDSGDHQIYTVSGVTQASKHEDYDLEIRPDGISSGYKVLSAGDAADEIDVAAHSVYIGGTELDVTAETFDVSTLRPATNVAKVVSICVYNSSGTATVAAVEGTDGATTAFSSTRGAAGGPPLITADYVEIGQWRPTASAAGAVTADELFQVPNQHVDRADFPQLNYPIHCMGDGEYADTAAQKNFHVKFAAARQANHVGPATGKVYAKVATPVFSTINHAHDFSPAERSYSANSVDTYDGAYGGDPSESLGQCSFKMVVDNATINTVVAQKGKTVAVEFYEVRTKSRKIVQQGKLGVNRSSTFPASGVKIVECTLTTALPSVEFAS